MLPKLISSTMVERINVLRRHIEVLIVTATETEKRAVLARMTPLPSKRGILKGPVGPATYYVGRLGTHGVALTMCRMGAVGGGSSKDAVADGCKEWAPRAVIMVGIAFGRDPAKQGIGDILVSSQIISYAERRVGARIEHRGPIVEASRTLVDRFRNVDGWAFARADGTVCEMRMGPVLSGEELVDDPARKAELFGAFPQAIGGEMEGRGLYGAAHDAKVDWILVKGICDWADGTKHKQDQPFAAAAAVDLVHRVLSDHSALDGLPKKDRGRTDAQPSKRSVEVRGRSVGLGGDMTNSVAITGHVEGNVYIGPPIQGPEEALRIYCEVVVKTCSRLPLRAVDVAEADPTHPAERMDLAAVYMDLETKTPAPGKVAVGAFERGAIRRLRALEAVTLKRRAVFLGDPGSGKSTFLSHIALCLAGSHLEPRGDWIRRLAGWKRATSGLLPILVVLRDFAAVLPESGPIAPSLLWSFIVDRLHDQNLEAAAEPLHAALDTGRAIVLLDGLDEIPSTAQQLRVRDAVAAFAGRYEKNDLIVTCRTLSYRLPRCQLAGMPSFEIAPFDDDRIDRFIVAWYDELARRGTVGATDAVSLARDLREAVTRPDLRELAPNPLLLTVMALVHASDGRLPGARALLYDRTVDLLLWRWDDHRTRHLRTLLEQAGVREIDLKEVLWMLAFEAHKARPSGRRSGLADIPEWRILKALAERHPNESLDWAMKVVEAMKLRAGLLLERKREVYTFPHRTFQEYLAGCHLSVQDNFAVRAAKMLRKGPVWREVVLLAAGRLGHLTGGTDRLVGLLGELCPESVKDPETSWHDVCTAADVLAEVGANRLMGTRLGRDLTNRVRRRLVEMVREERLAPVHRVRVGDTLGNLGDSRFRRKEEWHLPADEGLGFVEIPGGTFLMGSDPATDLDAFPDEMPQHTVSLPLYYMARYPVTVDQFRAFAEETGIKLKHHESLLHKPNHPVVQVSWEEAWAYADWLTEKLRRWTGTPVSLARRLRGESEDGKPWRIVLPSEAEWEKAARGLDGRIYPWGNKADPHKANYSSIKIRDTTPVGCFVTGASPYGCEEMSGNVWEWTRSLWHKRANESFSYPYRAEDGREARKSFNNLLRVVRGGSSVNTRWVVRCAIRNHGSSNMLGRIGFRVAVSPFASVG
ncbi:MAG TPA: SUMF1/EgtB/PvdO family nonheme iron enzyme [Sorangium sp.]|nr:SUMF1/EgtB/PvdO family nonheme iron enzyme [Sorangium sp.]